MSKTFGIFLDFYPEILDHDTTLNSVNISSLYTSTNHDFGIEAVTYWINKHNDPIPGRFTDTFIIESLKFVLKSNNFPVVLKTP